MMDQTEMYSFVHKSGTRKAQLDEPSYCFKFNGLICSRQPTRHFDVSINDVYLLV